MVGGKVKVTTYQLNHQGINLGYRFEYGDDSICIITDNAPIDNGNYMGQGMDPKNPSKEFEEAFDAGLVEFLKENPDAKDLDVFTAKDAEGNEYDEVCYSPSKGYYDGDSYSAQEDFEDQEIDEDTELNAVCVN